MARKVTMPIIGNITSLFSVTAAKDVKLQGLIMTYEALYDMGPNYLKYSITPHKPAQV